MYEFAANFALLLTQAWMSTSTCGATSGTVPLQRAMEALELLSKHGSTFVQRDQDIGKDWTLLAYDASIGVARHRCSVIHSLGQGG
jgi:hypothetical protein